MSRKPSDATLLRAARRDIKILQGLRDTLTISRDNYRERATRAEQEVSDWRRRFDILLAKTPQLTPPHADDRMQKCIDLLRQNIEENYIPAIKLYRELFGASLVDAKNAIEAERNKMRLLVGAVNGPDRTIEG